MLVFLSTYGGNNIPQWCLLLFATLYFTAGDVGFRRIYKAIVFVGSLSKRVSKK